MGLLDILNGMQNGPRGRREPTPPGQGGGMSPLMMALIGLLAYKAFKGGLFGGGSGSQPTPVPGNAQTGTGSGGGLGDILGGMLGGPRGTKTAAPSQGGGLGDLLGGLLGGASNTPHAGRGGGSLADMLPGGLGGLLGGATAGGVLGSGLGNLIKDLQDNGQGRVAQSWVGKGPNESIAPEDLEKALGADTIEALQAQTGMPREQLLAGLSQELPEMVDQLTPDGRLPTEDEAARW